MQVSVEAIGTLERRITVEIPEEQVRSEVTQRLLDLSRKIRIDGFRVGKVPVKVVEHRYGAELRREAIEKLLRSSFEEAIRDRHMHPAGDPAIEPVALDPGHGLIYKATFEIYPDLTLKPVEALRIRKAVCEITEGDVERALEALRHRLREWQEVDRPAESGDLVEIDYEGHTDGVAIEGANATGVKVELGAGGLPAGFSEALVGARANDQRTAEIDRGGHGLTPADSGKTVTLQVKVNKVSKPILPPLDEALAERLGAKDGGLPGLRSMVRQELERQRDRTIEERCKREVLQALVAANPIELPKVAVEQEVQRLRYRGHRAHSSGGGEGEDRHLPPREIFEAEARRRVALGLIIGEIARIGGLSASPAAVRAAVSQIAEGFADPATVVKWYYEERGRLAPVAALVLEDQAVAWVLARAQIAEQRLTFDELGDNRQTEFFEGVANPHAHP